MTQEEKQLLLQDLCTRLPYKIRVKVSEVSYSVEFDVQMLAEIKNNNWYEYPIPYLRPMSSMTEEEKEEIKPLFSKFTDEFGKRVLVVRQNKMALYQDFLNAHHFDYRGLIEKGLAIEVTKDNNPYKE